MTSGPSYMVNGLRPAPAVGDLVDLGDGLAWVAVGVHESTVTVRRLGWLGALWRAVRESWEAYRADARLYDALIAKATGMDQGGLVPPPAPPPAPADRVADARARVPLSLVRYNLGVRIYGRPQLYWYALFCMNPDCRATYGFAPTLHAGFCWKCRPQDWSANDQPI